MLSPYLHSVKFYSEGERLEVASVVLADRNVEVEDCGWRRAVVAELE